MTEKKILHIGFNVIIYNTALEKSLNQKNALHRL